MIQLLQKLLMMRQFTFGQGMTKILGERVVLGPVEIIAPCTSLAIEKPEYAAKLYEGVRTSFNDGWADAVGKMYGFKPQDYFKFLIDMSKLGGWGEGTLVEFNSETSEGKFINNNSAMGSYFKGKSTRPVDHIWRGLAAGGLSKAFKKDIDWFETKCIATGAERCEFVFKPREKFIQEKSEEIISQIPI